MFKLHKLIYGNVPHNFARTIYRIRHPDFYAHMQKKRLRGDGNYSYEQFDRMRCIFIHIPKTAGSTIARAIFSNLAAGHDTIDLYRILFNKQEYDSYFKFTVVRNPWERLLSAYRYLSKGGGNANDQQWAAKHIQPYKSFKDFLCSSHFEETALKWVHFQPQYKFLCPFDSEIPQVDFIARHENIDDDFKTILQNLNLNENIKLPTYNVSNKHKSSDYRNLYDKKMIDIVSSVYYKDIKLFNYNFQ